MKKLFLPVTLALIAFTSCHKEDVKPNQPTQVCENEAFQANLVGAYEIVGFKDDLFGEWSYTSSGAVFEVQSNNWIEYEMGDFFKGDYYIVNDSTFFLRDQNLECVVRFEGDTTHLIFENEAEYKCINW